MLSQLGCPVVPRAQHQLFELSRFPPLPRGYSSRFSLDGVSGLLHTCLVNEELELGHLWIQIELTLAGALAVCWRLVHHLNNKFIYKIRTWAAHTRDLQRAQTHNIVVRCEAGALGMRAVEGLRGTAPVEESSL